MTDLRSRAEKRKSDWFPQDSFGGGFYQPAPWEAASFQYGYQPEPWEFQPDQQQSYGRYESHAGRYPDARSTGASTLRYTYGNSWAEGGCTVASIATVAKVPYETARELAVEIGGFSGDGLGFADAQNVLASLGVSATTYDQGTSWSEIPDLAIVTVNHPTGIPHAVVFRRKGGQETIWDHGEVSPRAIGSSQSNGPYELYSDGAAEYIEIHK